MFKMDDVTIVRSFVEDMADSRRALESATTIEEVNEIRAQANGITWGLIAVIRSLENRGCADEADFLARLRKECLNAVEKAECQARKNINH